MKGDRALDAYSRTAPEYPFSFHLFGATEGDTRDRLSIKHSEKRLKGRFYQLLPRPLGQINRRSLLSSAGVSV